ncbi:hypothetical protein M951_chr3158 (nucleomorph) [Lotharella oceanica]|uniref:Uncharacterized protein n=1 Tax=Lotharella oceanica TaxID=641309 RepID=A0A060DC38_9EUKA|nr:hypothetical protein M951_chr247 [Lotharella oceanica]AIB09953.1 hypothetical protein M951_chr347 [Lotharella oceanica]AIB10055.1 hypothetical protein M951_chr3158 [Lotharella oceanica]
MTELCINVMVIMRRACISTQHNGAQDASSVHDTATSGGKGEKRGKEMAYGSRGRPLFADFLLCTGPRATAAATAPCAQPACTK